MPSTLRALVRDPPAAAGLVVVLAGAGTLAVVWYFQLVVGLAPCPLCLQQRWPYYLGIPVALLVAVGAARGAPRRLLAGGLIVLALLMLVGAGLGLYHAGIEWKWWEGPQDCTGAGFAGGAAGNLLQRMQRVSVVRCDEAAWRFLGLSFAGWNVLMSLALAATAVWGASRAWRAEADPQAP